MEQNYKFGGVFDLVKKTTKRNYCGGTTTYTEASKVYIKKVIYNDPATIVFWSDDTKTIAKCQEGDKYSKEFGLTLAVLKKVAGTQTVAALLTDWVVEDSVVDIKKVRANQKVSK